LTVGRDEAAIRAYIQEQRAEDRVLKHANAAVDETRRTETFRTGGQLRGLLQGKRWLLSTRWQYPPRGGQQTLAALFAGNRRRAKTDLLLDELEPL